MTNQEKIAFKIRLKDFGLDILRRRIATAQAAMEQAQEAANAEEKSSSGDKYETGRSMAQLQKELYGRQLAEYAKEIKTLQAVSVESLCERGCAGALIQLKGMALFVSAGLGKKEFDGLTIVFVSPVALLARSLQGKKAGDEVIFNEKRIVIEEVY